MRPKGSGSRREETLTEFRISETGLFSRPIDRPLLPSQPNPRPRGHLTPRGKACADIPHWPDTYCPTPSCPPRCPADRLQIPASNHHSTNTFPRRSSPGRPPEDSPTPHHSEKQEVPAKYY